MQAIGEWLSRYGESIYGTQAGITGEQAWGVSTQKDNVLYLHVLDHQESITLSDVAKPLGVVRLCDGEAVPYTWKKGVLTVTPSATDLPDNVIKVQFKKK